MRQFLKPSVASLSADARQILENEATSEGLPIAEWRALLEKAIYHQQHYLHKSVPSRLPWWVNFLYFLFFGVRVIGGFFACAFTLFSLVVALITRFGPDQEIVIVPFLIRGALIMSGVWLATYPPLRYWSRMEVVESHLQKYRKRMTRLALVSVLDFIQMLEASAFPPQKVAITWSMMEPWEDEYRGQRFSEQEDLPTAKMAFIRCFLGQHSVMEFELESSLKHAAGKKWLWEHLEVIVHHVVGVLHADLRDFERGDGLPYGISLKERDGALVLEMEDVQPLEPKQMEDTNGLRVVYRELLAAVKGKGEGMT